MSTKYKFHDPAAIYFVSFAIVGWVLDPNVNMFEERINYLHNNPVKAGLVANAAEYLYSSATDYEGGKGLIEIDVSL